MEHKCQICGSDAGIEWYQLRDGSTICAICLRRARLRSLLYLDDYNLESLKSRIEKKEEEAKGDPSKAINLLPELVEPFLEVQEKKRTLIIKDRMRGGMFKPKPNKYILAFDDVLDFVLIDDGVEVAKGSRGGELISTGVKSEDKVYCNQLELILHLADQEKPECHIYFVQKKAKRVGTDYRVGRGSANSVMKVIQMMFDHYPL